MNCECTKCKNNNSFEMPQDIIEAAKNENLVLFCGAGISTENKNVLPFSFYSTIQEKLGISDNSISFSDMMQKYCEQPDGRKKLLKEIRERFNYIHSFPELERQATDFHRELSEIYSIKTIITTNWDTYFEDFCSATPITIPEDFAFWDDHSRYVLKIHGSINNLGTIVASTDDYNKCFKRLQNGIIGATLKNILVTKTVVFIGFSFGDDDFAQIINYLRNEMGELYPHIYIVTLDEDLTKRLNYKNSSAIITDGAYFIHQLKVNLQAEGFLNSGTSYGVIDIALDKMNLLHSEVAKISLKEHPSVLYTLAYQDGVIHAFERFLQNYNTGEYNRPGYSVSLAQKYITLAEECNTAKNYWDMSYYEGYANGLILIEACEHSPDAIYSFPFLFLPNAKKPLESYDIYTAELERISSTNGIYQKYARNIASNYTNPDIITHHPPY